VKTYLGRPWRGYSAVTFINTEMSANVQPAGWDNWKLPEREKTVRYAEYGSTGAGSNSDARVKWARKLSDDEAREITVEKVLAGNDGWNPNAAQ
jgi:pectinesterase